MENIPPFPNRSKDNKNIEKQENRFFLINTTKYIVTISRKRGEEVVFWGEKKLLMMRPVVCDCFSYIRI